MVWRVFRSIQEVREALDHLEISGFDISSALSEKIRLTAATSSRVLHSEQICTFNDPERGVTPYQFDKSLLHEVPNVRKSSYDSSGGWREYRLGEVLSGVHQVCQACTPRSLSGALGNFMDFCHAILDAENMELRRENHLSSALSSSFSRFMNLQQDRTFCAPDRILNAIAIHEETVALYATMFINRELNLKSIKEIEKSLPLKSRDSVKLSDLRLEIAANPRAMPNHTLHPLLSLELLLVRDKLSANSDVVFFKEMRPRSVAPVTVAFSSGSLSLLATGGFFLPVASCFSQEVITTDPRAQIVTNIKTSDARSLCDLASSMMGVGGDLADPRVSIKNASLILGLEVNTV